MYVTEEIYNKRKDRVLRTLNLMERGKTKEDAMREVGSTHMDFDIVISKDRHLALAYRHIIGDPSLMIKEILEARLILELLRHTNTETRVNYKYIDGEKVKVSETVIHSTHVIDVVKIYAMLQKLNPAEWAEVVNEEETVVSFEKYELQNEKGKV